MIGMKSSKNTCQRDTSADKPSRRPASRISLTGMEIHHAGVYCSDAYRCWLNCAGTYYYQLPCHLYVMTLKRKLPTHDAGLRSGCF